MLSDKEQQDSEYKKKREAFSENIRRANREQKFKKRRNLQNQHFAQGQEEQSQKYQRQIIDPQLFEQILPICNQEFSETDLPALISALKSNDIIEKHYGIIGLRKLLAIQVDPPIQTVIDNRLVPIFMEFASQNQYPQLKLQSVWCLTNIASGTNQHCQAIVEKGALEMFINCLKQNQKGVIDQAVWAIGNLAADRIAYRDKILAQGGVSLLINVIQNSNNKTLIKNGSWSLTNLCRGIPTPNFNKIKQAIPVFCKVLKSQIIKDKQVIADICWALSYMSEGAKSRIQRVLQQGVLKVLFEYARSPFHLLCVPALRVIGNFSTGNELQTQELINNGIFDLSFDVLKNVKKTMRRQMCWILSNIVVGPSSHAQTFMAHKVLVQRLLALFDSDPVDIRRQICWIFANLGHSGNLPNLIVFYQQYQIVRYYVQMLTEEDQEAIQNALQTLYKILMYGDKCKVNNINIVLKNFENIGGTQKLESLQFHSSKDIYDLVIRIIQTFYNYQDETFQM